MVHKGRKARRTSWILRATTLGFIYTLDVLLSKLSLSVSVSSNDKARKTRQSKTNVVVISPRYELEKYES